MSAPHGRFTCQKCGEGRAMAGCTACPKCMGVDACEHGLIRTHCVPCARREGAAEERARVVAWINAGNGVGLTSYEIADAIERGEHVKP